jgi:hypothetical protein
MDKYLCQQRGFVSGCLRFSFFLVFFLCRLRTPNAYSEDPAEALVLFRDRFMGGSDSHVPGMRVGSSKISRRVAPVSAT